MGFAEYVILTAKGIDDNGNQVEDTVEMDILPN